MESYSKKYFIEGNIYMIEANWENVNTSIVFPSDWVEVKTEFNSTKALLRIEKNDGIIMLSIERYDEPVILDDYCGWYCEDRKIDTDKFIETGVTNINETEALWYLYLADELIDDQLLDKTILIAKENYAFRLHLISNASTYESNDKEFSSIVNSFKF